jgi:type IX secretion system PorP/SprF family membrane protein
MINPLPMNKIIKIICLILIPVSVSGQLTPVTNQYILNMVTINPAYAGKRGDLNVTANYRKQWAGIQGSPETITFTVDGAVSENKVGLGLNFVSDEIGVTRSNFITTNYSYIIDMGKSTLSLGLGAGIITTNTAWSDLVVIDKGDDLIPLDSRRFIVPSFSFGAFFENGDYFLGFSVPKFFGYKFNYDKNRYNVTIDPRQYDFLLYTGYSFKLSPKTAFIPSTLLDFRSGNKTLFDLNANLSFNNRFIIGTSYRNARSFGALVQLRVNNQLNVAYTYDFDTGALKSYSNGSHEVMLRYEFRYKIDVVNPLIF